MLNNSHQLLTALAPWNAWDEPSPFTGLPRGITETLFSFLDRPEAIVLTGMRRSGKSTVMYQLIERLVEGGADRHSILFVNFDEPALEPSRGSELLENIYRAFRQKLCPAGRAYLFFDEIQHVPGWERWVSSRLKTEDIRVVISGSSAQVMSREIATLLTGRNLTFRIHPLSFAEFLRFRKISIDINAPLSWEKRRSEIEHELDNFLQWGALPEAVLAQNDIIRRKILSQYLDDLLFKDVIIRHEIRDAGLLRDFAVYLLTHSACRMTLQSLRKAFGISLDKARRYLSYLEEPYLVSVVKGYARSLKSQQVSVRKIYAGDTGLRNAASLSPGDDLGRLEETVVFHKLSQAEKEIYCWHDQNREIDFLVCDGLEPTEIIQVTHSDLTDRKTRKRELAPLLEPTIFPGTKRLLLTHDWPKGLNLPETINNSRLWEWLLAS